jgi:hypothetical protein
VAAPARRGVTILAVSALALALGVATFAATKVLRRATPFEARSSASATTETATDPAPVGSSTGTEVLVHVESRPPGARVLADGAEIGVTPVDLHLARGATPVVLELRRTGFAATTQTIVPDADQKLLLSLQPAGRQRPGPKAGASAAASGFRRFD